MQADEWKEIILDHYQNPRNKGALEHPTMANRGYSPLCGDEIELSVELDPAGERIQRIAFDGRGCSVSQASASMMTEALQGHTLTEAQQAVDSFAQRMTTKGPPPAEIDEEIDALQSVKNNPSRVKCAMLPWTTLREAVDTYKKSDA